MEATLPSGETEDAEAVVSVLAARQHHLQKISMATRCPPRMIKNQDHWGWEPGIDIIQSMIPMNSQG